MDTAQPPLRILADSFNRISGAGRAQDRPSRRRLTSSSNSMESSTRPNESPRVSLIHNPKSQSLTARYASEVALVIYSAFVAEALDVLGAFFQGADVAALDLFANLGDDVRIGESGDIAGVHLVGDGGQDAAHNFA